MSVCTDFLTGVNTYVEIVYSGSYFIVSGDGNRASLDQSVDTRERQTYATGGGVDTVQRAAGLKDWTFTFDGFFNTDCSGSHTTAASCGVDAVLASAFGKQVELIYGPAGSDTGKRKYSGSGIITRYTTESPVDDMITTSFEIVASCGSLTVGTF